MTPERAFLDAVTATATYYAAKGDAIAAVIARRAPSCETLEDFDRRVAPALEEYGQDIPEPLRLLMRDRPAEVACGS